MLIEIQLNDGSAVFALESETHAIGDVTVTGTCVRLIGRNMLFWPIQSADIRSKLIAYIARIPLDAAEKDEGYARILKVLRGEKLEDPEEE